MDERMITETMVAAYGSYLKDEEKAIGTVENYLRHVRHFAVWLDGRAVTKETAAGWKEALVCEGYRPPLRQRHADCAERLFCVGGLA